MTHAAIVVQVPSNPDITGRVSQSTNHLFTRHPANLAGDRHPRPLDLEQADVGAARGAAHSRHRPWITPRLAVRDTAEHFDRETVFTKQRFPLWAGASLGVRWGCG
jgi:hypothetical protein